MDDVSRLVLLEDGLYGGGIPLKQGRERKRDGKVSLNVQLTSSILLPLLPPSSPLPISSRASCLPLRDGCTIPAATSAHNYPEEKRKKTSELS